MRIAALVCLAVFTATPCAAGEKDPAKKGPVSVKENRLAKERSPYLRQHKNNPVDWYPWGEEAFALAKKLDRPVFLSVGYAACHWCHVMEHESFEDEATAKILNEHYVCVKVDREERPDVDRVYMNAVHAQRQGGGWPMTVLMLPDGRPFFTATYLRPEQLKQLTDAVDKAWKTKRAELEATAAQLTEAARSLGAGRDLPDSKGSDDDLLALMRNALAAAFDSLHGGYGNQRKFPPHSELLFFLEDEATRARSEDLEQIQLTLDAMERGGLHDHVGGGFHRYCTDREWLLPHFEKMLYDNALLARGFAAAAAVFEVPRYRRAAERTFDWLEREMARPGGGYASSLDADTEGEEGLTYTWTQDELQAVLDAQELELLSAWSLIRKEGNFHDEATGKLTGRNIVYRAKRTEPLAKARKIDPETLFGAYEAILVKLQSARAKKPQPGLDDKVIVGWNGLLVSAYARAGKLLDNPTYVQRAKTLAQFLLDKCRRDDGTLLRFPKGSGPEIPGFCEDHVHLIEGLLDVAEVTGEDTWLQPAQDLGARLIDEFQDTQNGGFWTTSRKRHESLFTRAKETWDSPIPSDNGTAARCCLRLAVRTGDARFRKAADATLSANRPLMGFARMATGLVALYRALSDRLRIDEVAGGATRGDVHVRADAVMVDVFQEHKEATLGGDVRILVRVTLDDGWYLQPAQSADPLIPTQLLVTEGAPVTLDAVAFPDPVERDSPGADGPSKRYEGTFDVRATLRLPKDVPLGPRKVPLRLRFQACNDQGTCLPPRDVELDLPIRFAAEADTARHPAHFAK